MQKHQNYFILEWSLTARKSHNAWNRTKFRLPAISTRTLVRPPFSLSLVHHLCASGTLDQRKVPSLTSQSTLLLLRLLPALLVSAARTAAVSTMAGNDWVNSYLEAILDVDRGLDEGKSSLLLRERGHFSPTRYFVEEVITGFDETDLHRSWIRVSSPPLLTLNLPRQGFPFCVLKAREGVSVHFRNIRGVSSTRIANISPF